MDDDIPANLTRKPSSSLLGGYDYGNDFNYDYDYDDLDRSAKLWLARGSTFLVVRRARIPTRRSTADSQDDKAIPDWSATPRFALGLRTASTFMASACPRTSPVRLINGRRIDSGSQPNSWRAW